VCVCCRCVCVLQMCVCVCVCVWMCCTLSLFSQWRPLVESQLLGGVGWFPELLLLPPASVLAQVVPFGYLPAGVFTHLPPVGGAGGGGAVQAEQQAAQHLVLSGPVEVDHQELHRDLGQELRRDVVDEGLVEDGVQRALLDVGLLLGDALTAVEDVHLHVGV